MQEHTRDQIAKINLVPDRPLLIVDADEVLVHFARPFTRYLEALEWELHLTEYRLEYAIKRADGFVANPDMTFELVHGFIDAETRLQPAIDGATGTLADLAKQAQIVVLSNVPQRRYLDRQANLEGHGMPYPLVANSGPKGPALMALTARMQAPVAFVDDSPAQIESAAEHADHIHRVHFTGCDIIRSVLPDVKCANATPEDWSGVASHIGSLFAK